MYAAAGGASLASRQARQKQRQNKKQQQLKNQKASDLLPKQPQAKQFHNYTDPAVPRLSRVERGALKPPQQHERRHSTSNYLKEPRARIRESPSISIPVQNHQPPMPLTPCTLVQQHNHLPLHSTTTLNQQVQLPQIFIPEDSKLERRCSFVRQVEEMEKPQEGGVLDRCNHICNFEIKDKQWENHTSYYTEYDKEVFGSLEYPFSEVCTTLLPLILLCSLFTFIHVQSNS